MKQIFFTLAGCLVLALFTAMNYTPANTTLPTGPSQDRPYKVVKNGIYLKAGLAIAFSNKRSALVYDPKTYVAVESDGHFTAVHRKKYNNTDCDCASNQVCVNGKCVDIKENIRPDSRNKTLHVNGISWSRSKACASAQVRVQGSCSGSTNYGEDLCGDQCPDGEVCVRDHESGDRVCVPYKGGNKIAGLLQTVSW